MNNKVTIPVTGKQIGAAIDALVDEVERYRKALETLHTIKGLGARAQSIINRALEEK